MKKSWPVKMQLDNEILQTSTKLTDCFIIRSIGNGQKQNREVITSKECIKELVYKLMVSKGMVQILAKVNAIEEV